jgi:hypothetical protein
MKRRQYQTVPWWQEPEPPQPEPYPTPAAPAPAPSLSPGAQQLIEELAAYGVQYRPEAPCERCGCPLWYPLIRYPDCVLCCICYPGGRRYGYERHDRILKLFPRQVWRR